MLKKILFEIKNLGYISKSNIARKLNISEELVEDGINQLVRMGYIKEIKNVNSCSTSCGNCPYANTCNKTFIKTMEITEKGEKLLNNL